MRLVLDTNVVVSGLLWDGTSAQLLDAQADLIVSGDQHLLDLGRFHNIPIVKPAAAVKIVGE